MDIHRADRHGDRRKRMCVEHAGIVVCFRAGPIRASASRGRRAGPASGRACVR